MDPRRLTLHGRDGFRREPREASVEQDLLEATVCSFPGMSLHVGCRLRCNADAKIVVFDET
jgi:hypothetical protein